MLNEFCTFCLLQSYGEVGEVFSEEEIVSGKTTDELFI